MSTATIGRPAMPVKPTPHRRPADERLLAAVAAEPGLHAAELGRRLGVSKQAIAKRASLLVAAGRLRKGLRGPHVTYYPPGGPAPMPAPTTTGQAIAHLRERKGLPRAAAARMAGVAESTVRRAEADQSDPTLGNVLAWLKSWGVTRAEAAVLLDCLPDA